MANKKNVNEKSADTTKKSTANKKSSSKKTTSSSETTKRTNVAENKEVKSSTKKVASAKTTAENTKKAKDNTKDKKKTNTSKKKNVAKEIEAVKEDSTKEVKTQKENTKKSNSKSKTSTKKESNVSKNQENKVKKNSSTKTGKDAAKKESKITVPTVDNEHRIKKGIIIIVSCILVLALTYLLTVFIIDNRSNDQDGSTSEAIIQYDTIMIGSSLVQNAKTYYVLITSKDDPNYSNYLSYVQSYAYKEGSLKIYTADYEEGFNKKYMSENSNLLVEKISDLKITGSTLLKVDNKKIVEAYEKDKLLTTLSDLVK